jgi:isocitrate dehydrogenase
MQVIKYAFEMAKKKGTRRITCGHKANIMKQTDGLFLQTFMKLQKSILSEVRRYIVDDLCMKLVTRPIF